MLYTPCLKLSGINWIGQSPRGLVSKVWPPRVTQHVDDLLPAELLRPHGYHQPLPRPDAALVQAVANHHESEPNRSALIRKGRFLLPPR
jgi:hypothetical protein